jgi:cell division initiation protein
MLNSQQVLEQMKENARKSAEVIIADAEVKAEKILNRAHNRLSQLHEDIAELKRQRMQIEVQIRSIIEAHTKLLEIGKESMDAMDESDGKVAVLKQPTTF